MRGGALHALVPAAQQRTGLATSPSAAASGGAPDSGTAAGRGRLGERGDWLGDGDASSTVRALASDAGGAEGLARSR